jgi:hypothetical protein
MYTPIITKDDLCSLRKNQHFYTYDPKTNKVKCLIFRGYVVDILVDGHIRISYLCYDGTLNPYIGKYFETFAPDDIKYYKKKK